MPTILNTRANLNTDPIRNFRFLATFEPLSNTQAEMTETTTIGFTSISGLSITTESIPYREGGYNTSVHQIPGQSTFSPITFQRGVILGTDRNWRWMKRLYNVVNGQGGAADQMTNFRCDITINVLQHPMSGSSAGTVVNAGANSAGVDETTASKDDLVALKFKIYNAWVTSLAYSDLNAGDNALMVEQMTVVHEGFDMSWAKTTTDSAPEFTY
ncbi:MAG: phage tail protein [Microbacteriaceae bacterium]|nr:phage tail protein [Microbacteriaceae bacterium]